jgi:hypothetical protein
MPRSGSEEQPANCCPDFQRIFSLLKNHKSSFLFYSGVQTVEEEKDGAVAK